MFSHACKRLRLQAGFTLVELAVCLMIIGLLIGGVLRMNELIYIAQVRRLMSDVNGTMAAIKGFQTRFEGVPGDFALAAQQLRGCEPGNSNTCFAGDGNSMIGCVAPNCGFVDSGWHQDQTGTAVPQRETTLFWKHLALSGFIKSVNPAANIANPRWGETHPPSTINGGYEIFTDTQTAGSAISIRGQLTPRGSLHVGSNNLFLTGKQARYIDEKYDDGMPGAGYYWAIPPAGNGCRTGWNTYNPNLLEVPNSCAFHIIMH
jgi:prepilin-type N-terminal cleavage/methylation domain-containing protein